MPSKPDDEYEYEYRVTGCTGSGWKRTEWSDREMAVRLYGQVEWSMTGFERRVAGDDATIQRKQSPDSDGWMNVTEDKIHFEDEEVPA